MFHRKTRQTLVITLISVLVIFITGSGASLRTAEHRNGFDTSKPSWQIKRNDATTQLLAHRRSEQILVRGLASESVQFNVNKRGGVVECLHTLPPARVIDELKATLWFRSNRAGAQLYLRVVFPHQRDRSTGAVLSTWLPGSQYERAGKWEQLVCQTERLKLDDQIRRLRARLNDPHLDFRDAFVDRVIISAQLMPGAAEFYMDELRFGPIVKAEAKQNIVRASAQDNTHSSSPVEFQLDTLLVEGRPFFPRITPYHEEEIKGLSDTGLNVFWIPDYRNNQLISELHANGIWSTAVPPQARGARGEVLSSSKAGLPTFDRMNRAILFWNLGQRISPADKENAISWAEQIRSADLKHHRPLLADVTGEERLFSRHIPMLGVSRHTINTSLSLRDYRDWLIMRRRLSRPGSFTWTWVQTEPNSISARKRFLSHKEPIVIEPEQIRLQVYAALAAGCRGVGYWKTSSLNSNFPGARERKLVISQINMELDLIEEWLASGTVVAQVPFTIDSATNSNTLSGNIGFRNAANERGERDAILRERKYQAERNELINKELEATIIRGNSGLLLLPVWYGKDAQFCPGKMAANDVSIVVPGVDEAASAWKITTTNIRSLPRERVAGGIRITMKKFDQTAMIILTSDRNMIARLRNRIATQSTRAARIAIELAKTKYERVQQIDAQLQQLGTGQPDASQLLTQARNLIEQSEASYRRQDAHSSRELADDAMQSLRILQRAHWNDAVRSFSTPVSSSHTISFQTLPDHWRMLARLGRSTMKNENNILRSGNFEDIDTMLVEGWRHAQNDANGIQSTAELHPVAKEGKYSLRLIAVPETGQSVPKVIGKSPVIVSTPPIEARSGQIMHISGWVKVSSPVVGSDDGFMLYDSIGGATNGIRWKTKSNWQHFELIREVSKSDPFRLTMALTGLGEVHIDNLKIIPHDPRTITAGATAPRSSDRSPLNARELWNRLPSIPRPELPQMPSLPRPQMPSLPRPEMPDFSRLNPLSGSPAEKPAEPPLQQR